MSSVKNRQQKAGFLKSNQTPTCSNCLYRENALCICHEFTVGLSSWCPQWQPNNNWITTNTNAYLIIKERNDLAQQSTAIIDGLRRDNLEQQTLIETLRQKIHSTTINDNHPWWVPFI